MTPHTSSHTSRVRVDPAGRVIIPSVLRVRFHITPGDELLMSTDADGIHLRTYEQVVKAAQEAFAPFRKAGESVVDELIADRREEARREYGE